MSQPRRMSFVESWVNIAVGLVVSMAANATVLPALGFHLTVRDNIVLTVIYTAISLVRSYLLRRLFNRWGG